MAIRGFRNLLETMRKRRQTSRRRSLRRAFQKQLGQQRAHEPLEARLLLSGSPYTGVDASGNIYGWIPKEPDDLPQAAPLVGHAPPQNYPLEDTFRLHSNPGASKVIYLDFDGHTTTGTLWNSSRGIDPMVTPPFDIDGDPSRFSTAELQLIQDAWDVVSEDFRPFDVDVTTEDPGVEALRNTGGGDTEWGIRVVIGPDQMNTGAGGIAYLNSFSWNSDTPAFVFNTSFRGVAEAATHEVGHTLGLRHDGDPTEEYYPGHGAGPTGWAPIMGVGYYRELVQWSKGEYPGANNQEDDLAIIVAGNGFGYRVDDHGNTFATATPLEVSSTLAVWAEGIIERTTDVDVFSFDTGQGLVSLDIEPFYRSPNLDILANLYDSAGQLVATSNPRNALDASFNLSLAAGTYYVTIEGTGKPAASGDPGYSDYGSLGYYSINGSIVDPRPRPPRPTRAAPGPQIIAARPNDGDLLLTRVENSPLTVAPRELQLLFRGGANIDGSVDNLAQGIRITRQGSDGAFDYAYAKTDFNTAGAVVVRFDAVRLGQTEEGIAIEFTKSEHATDDPRPTIRVLGKTISIDLNSKPGAETTARALVDALDADPAAAALVRASITGNTALPLTDNLARAAWATSDFNTVTNPLTGGTAELEFTAVTAGAAGNGLQIVVTKSDHANQSMVPTVSVSGNTITIDLNEEVGFHTRAQQVVDAVNQHAVARTLVRARVRSGNLLADVAAPDIDYSPLALSGGDDGNGFLTPLAPLHLEGAGRAETTSSFGVPGLEVLIRATSPGLAGDGIQVNVLSANLGVNKAPTVAVRQNKITVTLNTNPTTPRNTASDLVNAINSSPAAAALVRASVALGNPASVISAAAPTTLETSGADEVIVPGYVGLGETSSEIIVRFAETLPDDTYRVELFAKDYTNLSIHALRNTAGTPLRPARAGDDRETIDFTLNLAPQVISVVPQPVTRRIQVRMMNTPNDGDFQLIFRGERTANLPVATINAQAIQTALEALPSIEPGEVRVTGPNLGPWEISFLGRYVNLPLADLRSDEPVIDIRYLAKLTQAEDQVLVYFNDDDLSPTAAVDRQFYRLIATGATGSIGDDLILTPHSVFYDADLDLAVLRFDDDGDLATPYRLPHGTYRLEVGRSEEANNARATATIVGALYTDNPYRHVATLEGGDVDVYQISLPDNGDLHVTVTPDAELTPRGFLDTAIVLTDAAGLPLDASNEFQRLSYGGAPTAGTTFTLGFGVTAPTTTVPLSYDADATTIQAALEALGDIYPGDVAVTGGPLNVAPIDIEFTGGLAGASVDKLLITDNTGGRLRVQRTDRVGGTGLAAGIYYVEVSRVDGAGSYLVEVTSSVALNVDDDNSSFATATQLGLLGVGGQVVFSQIEPQATWLPQYPGAEDEPGHRRIQAEQHISFLFPAYDLGVDPLPSFGTGLRPYNFQDVIGEVPPGSGNLLYNLITEKEKQLAREILAIYSSQLGIQFVETPDLGTTIAKGDLRAADPTITSGVGGVAGLGGPGLVVVDGLEGWTSSEFGGDFFRVLFHEIGHSLGLGHAYDLPALMGAGAPNDVYPGDDDIVHAQRLWRPDANDIDLYQFEVTTSGTFQAETVAQRAVPYSFLDTVLTLFSRDGQILARNDDYYGLDSFLKLELAPGTYYVGVTSRGNTAYDPNVPDSGFGGLTDGDYELRMGFEPDQTASLVDATGVPLDGDHDGRPGGVFEFWFQASDDVIFVDKARDTLPSAPEGTGTAADPYDSIATALADARTRIVTPARGSSVIRDGDSFVVYIGATPRTFEFDVLGDGVTAGRTAVAVPVTEIQRLAYAGVATSGTFSLAFGAAAPRTTGPLSYNATAPDVQAALESLGDIRPGEVRVTGGPLHLAPIDVEFTGRFAGAHPTLLTVTDNTNGGAGAGLRATQKQSLAVSIRDAINSLAPPAAPIATLTPSATAVRLTSVPRVDVSGTPGLLSGSNIVRVVGNAGADNDRDTLGDNRPYLIGTSNTNAVLPDGDGLIVPQGVTLMIDEGALLKLRKANIDVGTSAVSVNRAAGAVQVLGTPNAAVVFRSYRDDTVGGDTDPTDVPAAPGDWGGIVLRDDADLEGQGVYLNWINHADMAYGGGKVRVDSVESSFAPIHLINARPAIGFNTIT